MKRLAALFAFAVAISAVGATSFGVWLTEIFWAVLVFGVLAYLHLSGRFTFSRTAYLFFGAWIALQTIGAHYTFEYVPMDWLMGPLGLERNPFDRIAHTCVGLFAYGVCEYVWRKGLVTRKGMAVFVGIASIVALAGLWEIVEWLYAVVEGGELGAAFLGSQGDPWDAQKDILCDTIGAFIASLLWFWRDGAGRRAVDGAEKCGGEHVALSSL